MERKDDDAVVVAFGGRLRVRMSHIALATIALIVAMIVERAV